jgi:hypothetical protein
LNPVAHPVILRRVLEANAHILESLELETIDHGKFMLHVNEFESAFHFTSLHHLSLSHISLRTTYGRILTECGFRLEELRSLRLRHCPHTLEFLNRAANSVDIIKLRSFEVVFDESSADEIYDETHPLERFLKAFKGLEEMYLSLQHTMSPIKGLLCSILHHKATLKRLIQHERGIDLNEESHRYQMACDESLPWEQHIHSALNGMALDSVGFCMSPSRLVGLSFDILYCFSYRSISILTPIIY